MGKLNTAQVQMLRELVGRRAPGREELVAAVESGTATRQQRQELCQFIGAEFAETGIGDDSEPTARGIELEVLLDVVNRPNLR